MKRILIIAIALTALSFVRVHAQQTLTQADSTTLALRMKTLREQEALLKSEIDRQDKRRDNVVNGVSAEYQEYLNDRQDSICLDLRSRLVAVRLEMKEITERSLLDAVRTRRTAAQQQPTGKKE